MTSHILERVPLQQVRLLPGEHFDAQQAGARYLLDLDVDRLLYPFRREAGLPQPTDADGNPVTSYPNWALSVGLRRIRASRRRSATVHRPRRHRGAVMA